MASTESVGWFGWLREASVPRKPIVLLQCLTTSIFLPPSTRSRLLISFATAETISPVNALLTRRIMALVVLLLRIHSRNSPTVHPLISS